MPWKLSTGDKYKYAVVVLFKNNFRPQSTELLEKIGFSHAMLKHNMKGIGLESYFINRSNGNKTVKKCRNCVIDYVWSQIRANVGLRPTFDKLCDEILRYVDDPKNGMSTFDLVDWAKNTQ